MYQGTARWCRGIEVQLSGDGVSSCIRVQLGDDQVSLCIRVQLSGDRYLYVSGYSSVVMGYRVQLIGDGVSGYRWW